MIIINSTYTIKTGEMDDFLQALNEIDYFNNVRGENGNLGAKGYVSIDSKDDFFMVVKWQDDEAFAGHAKTDHVAKLQDIKAKFVVGMGPEKFLVQD